MHDFILAFAFIGIVVLPTLVATHVAGIDAQ
jgi:hypothetical protein